MQLDSLTIALPDRYRIQREIGRGGMAVVYLAEDVPHGRDVAVKVLSPELTSSIDAERFRREIQIAARLSHPNILPAYDSGSANGALFYVMPFVQGESLRSRLDRESQLPIEEAIAITCEVADALSYAHSQGVVHRDIKPENILIQSGHAVVADFGIARIVEDSGAQKLTATGLSIGTAAYMSPEQFVGEKLDGRSDMYSLACVLYEMLVGQVPFTGPNAMAIMARATMQAVPSIRLVRSTVPEDVEAVIFHALEKTPADRFATIDEFKDALLSGNRGMTSAFAKSTNMYTAAYRAAHGRPAWNRRRSMMGAAVVVLLAASSVVAARGILGKQSNTAAGIINPDADPNHLGVLYFADESKDGSLRFLADGLTESLIDELSRVPALDVVSKNGVRQYRSLSFDGVPDSIQRTLKIGTVVRGEVEPTATGARVTVRLIEALSGSEITRDRFDVDTANAMAAQGELSRRVAEFLRKHLGEDVKLRESRAGASSPEAWTLVQRAEKTRKDADSLLAARQDSAALARLTHADPPRARAAQLDARWVQPWLTRAAIAYQRARATREQPALAEAAVDSGMAFVDRALQVDVRSADALELRGKLEFLRVDQRMVPEGPQYARLLDAAEKDLRAAVQENSSQAGAWAPLSRLAYKRQSPQEALLAAQAAYKADAYLSNAREILARLFWTSHDTENFPDAARWCAEGRRRFPADVFFVECRLWMLTTKNMQPVPADAWRWVDTLKAITPPNRWEYERRMGEMLVAGVLAKAGMRDSAAHVLDRAKSTPDLDPERELLGTQVVVRLFLKDYDRAMDDLTAYLAAHPDHRKGLATNTSPWWRDPAVQENRRFKALIAGAR